MKQQYVITIDVDMTESEDPANLSATLIDAVHGAVMSVPGVTGCDMVGVA